MTIRTNPNHVPNANRGNPFRPAENVFVYGEEYRGIPGLQLEGYRFHPLAEYAGCRLCGVVFQSDLDREFYQRYKIGLGSNYADLYLRAKDKRTKWRILHHRRYHTEEEIEEFTKTGFALTPEAAHKLAPFGFAPMGNLHEDITSAMLEAPRTPDNDCEV